jgi:hypothetical protein
MVEGGTWRKESIGDVQERAVRKPDPRPKPPVPPPGPGTLPTFPK